ncbi:MAG: hypothetical protein H7843_09230 [Nitrospirota bacterium]
MRETFESVNQLLSYYGFIKNSVRGIKTLLPKKHQGSWTAFSSMAVKCSLEDKFCFIGDVERYARAYHKLKLAEAYTRNLKHTPIPYDCLLFIMEQYYSTDISLWGLANMLKRRIEKGEPLPARLKHRQHISRILSDMKKHMAPYFQLKGYIQKAELCEQV